jgi:prevent-host-death family protein
MKERTISVTEFRTKCFQILEDVAAGRYTVIITKQGKPIAMVVPFGGTENHPAGRSDNRSGKGW